ncbi:MAG: AAA family ATPase, partial [Magnetococcales bacterium]|nr:AAA family ATPase [Magnetococcales bacterium]
MYLDHFSLRALPFSLTPDTDLFFTGGGRGEALEKLLTAIDAGEGFIKVMGEMGSGKTMLCRALCHRVPKSVQVALLLTPNLPPEYLLPAILQEFRLPPVEKNDMLAARQSLLNHLVTLNRQKQRALILIEDAHCMSVATLEVLRMLTNLETAHAKLVQIVLFTQPQFDRNLKTSSASQTLERFTTTLTLTRLSLNDTELYLHSRLQACGFKGERLFSSRAVLCLYQASQGRIQQINILAHKALQIGFKDASPLITSRHAMLAISANVFSRAATGWYRPALAAAGVAALLAGGFVLHSGANNPLPDIRAEVAQNKPTLSARAAIELQAPSDDWVTVTDETIIQTFAARTASQSVVPHLKPNDPLRETILESHQWLNKTTASDSTLQVMLLQNEAELHALEKQLAYSYRVFRLKNDALLVSLNECTSKKG